MDNCLLLGLSAAIFSKYERTTSRAIAGLSIITALFVTHKAFYIRRELVKFLGRSEPFQDTDGVFRVKFLQTLGAYTMRNYFARGYGEEFFAFAPIAVIGAYPPTRTTGSYEEVKRFSTRL
jgi:hypothetical protein